MESPIHVHYSCGCHNQPHPKVEIVGDKMCIDVKFKCQLCGIGDSQELIVGTMSISAVCGCPADCPCDGATAYIPLSAFMKPKRVVKRRT